jgi:hypothetical protein
MAADFDLTGLDKLTADLLGAGVEALPFVRQAVQGTALGVKKSWQGKVSGSRGLGGLARTVSYDTEIKGGAVTAEIGYDKGRGQGPLGNISEFGSKYHAPRGYGAAALHENEDDFVRGIEHAVDDALRAHDL